MNPIAELRCPACAVAVLAPEPGARVWCTACDAVFDAPAAPPRQPEPPAEVAPPPLPEPGALRRTWDRVAANGSLVAGVFVVGLVGGLGLGAALFRAAPKADAEPPATAPQVAASAHPAAHARPTGPVPPAPSPAPIPPPRISPPLTPPAPVELVVAPHPHRPVRGVHVPDGKPESVKLPGRVADVAVGGGGRYLVFRIANEARLAVFDAHRGEVAKVITLAESEFQFAAGADRIVVVFPWLKLLQEWSLSTFEKVRSVALPDALTRDIVSRVCMGSGTKGPLFAYLANEKRTIRLDLGTLQATELHWRKWGPKNAYGPLQLRATPDGGVLVGCDGGWSGLDVGLFGADGRFTSNPSELHAAVYGGAALPGADGRHVFTPGGVLDRSLALAEVTDAKGGVLLPGVEPGFFLALTGANGQPVVRGEAPAEVGVYNEDRRRLFTLAPLDDVTAGELPWDRRVFYYPLSGLLAVLDDDGDRLALHRVDLTERLKKADAALLAVLSRPPWAAPGEKFDYTLRVHSVAGGVRFRLQSGPKGMAVTDDGRLTWDVPELLNAPVPVQVSVTDEGGNETVHAFEVLRASPR